MLEHLDRRLEVPEMAAQVHQSPRSFARRFRAEVGTTPHRWLVDRRLDEAERRLETTDASVEHIAHDVGLGTADTLRHHLARRRGTTPTAHRRRFRTTGGPDEQ